MIKTQIVDGFGKGHKMNVTEEGTVGVVVHPHPPLVEEVEILPFSQYFTDNGTATGSNDMRVNGATTNVDFSVNAIQDRDLFIKTLTIEISDAGATLNEFGALSALANGVQFIWFTQDQGEYIINDGFKTNWEAIRMCGTDPYGGGGNAFKANNISGGSEGFTPVFDTQKMFGMPWGLRLKKGTKDKLIMRVRDNITAIDSFNIIAYGTRL